MSVATSSSTSSSLNHEQTSSSMIDGDEWEKADNVSSVTKSGEDVNEFTPSITDSPLQMKSSRTLLDLANGRQKDVGDEVPRNMSRRRNLSSQSLSSLFDDEDEQEVQNDRKKLEILISDIIDFLPNVREEAYPEAHRRISAAVKVLKEGDTEE